MARANGVGISARAFQDEFEAVAPLIREEWPSVEDAPLQETKGELEKVVALVAERTEHTKALVKRQLQELHEISRSSSTKGRGLEGALKEVEAKAREILERLEERGGEMSSMVKDELVPKAEAKVKENLLTSLLITLGFGFILGILFGRR